MASRSAIVDRLKAIPLFSRCTGRDLRVVARHMEIVKVPPGTNVVCAGEQGDVFYVVLSGEATVHRNGRTAGRLGPGDHFGELALLDPAPRAATVRATTVLELGTLGHRVFKTVLRDLPAVGSGLLASMAGELRDALGRTVV
jgi:CRP-like cAMP-binding protein